MTTRRGFLKIGGLTVGAFGLVRRLFAQSAPQVRVELQNLVAGVTPLPAEEYAARRERAQRLLAESRLDGFFCESGPTLQYFTGVSWGRSERPFGAVLTRSGEPTFICSRFELERAQEMIPAGMPVRTWDEDESPYALVGSVMKDARIRAGSLGIEPTTRAFLMNGLRRDAPSLHVQDGAVISEGCRGTKSPAEVAYMELANRITKLAYREALTGLGQGQTPSELEEVTRAAHQKMGVTGGGWPQFGPNTAFPHGSRLTRTLYPGDVVMMDGGCSVEGYRSDVTRSVVFGPPSDRQRRIWEAVAKAQQAAFSAVRPGVACEAIDRVARRVIEEAGFAGGYSVFRHRLGHGIGLEGHEYPYLVGGNRLPLKAGMTFSNEPGIYLYGECGIRTEDCFVVTEEGAAWLGGMVATAIDAPFGDAGSGV